MAGRPSAPVWSSLRSCLSGALVGFTVSDRYASIITVRGPSMIPTPGVKPGDCALVERLCLDRYDFSRGDVVVFRSPRDHENLVVQRLIALPGDWIQVPELQEIRQIPEGHCWVEGEHSASISWDSRSFGSGTGRQQSTITEVERWRVGDHRSSGAGKKPSRTQIPLGLMYGRVTHIVWPPNRIGRVERKMPEGRTMQQWF
ncbi:hypothetical protein GUJ93_ZPchr0023g33389 [Zizania palustris]|uniref:Mitochondrial inner membrane protease subunit 2 n=1 Tax=Zizania palustris TaxID=103762 RepID=A0A8J5R8V7_ZIZPA|nr:hypothetical protein GUJ93_ZPchr0023g33389 [Zizania palustris]